MPDMPHGPTGTLTPPPMPDMSDQPGTERTIIAIAPSAWWDHAVVIVTSVCQHRHVRPKACGYKIGDTFACPFCPVRQ